MLLPTPHHPNSCRVHSELGEEKELLLKSSDLSPLLGKVVSGRVTGNSSSVIWDVPLADRHLPELSPGCNSLGNVCAHNRAPQILGYKCSSRHCDMFGAQNLLSCSCRLQGKVKGRREQQVRQIPGHREGKHSSSLNYMSLS